MNLCSEERDTGTNGAYLHMQGAGRIFFFYGSAYMDAFEKDKKNIYYQIDGVSWTSLV